MAEFDTDRLIGTPPDRASVQAQTLRELLTRHSVGSRHLVDPGPDAVQLRLMAQVACRAPDHDRLRPFCFKVVRGSARHDMARAFAAAALDAGKDAHGAALDAERAARSPVTVAVIARIDLDHARVTPQEQWMAVGGAVGNFLNAAHLLGYAGQMLSGAKVKQPRLVSAFCGPGETLVGWIALGTSTRPAPGQQPPEDNEPPLLEWTANAKLSSASEDR